MNFGAKSPIDWCKGRPGKQNPMALKKKMISPDGRVVEVSMANGKALKNIHTAGPYGNLLLAQKLSKGWVDYDATPEAERERIISERQSAKSEQQAEFQKQHETLLDQKLSKIAEAVAVGNAGAIDQVVTTAATISKNTKKTSGRVPSKE